MAIVIKIGGSVVGAEVSATLLEDVRKASSRDNLILVHGGGDQVTEIAEKLGKPQKFIVSPEGIRSRYTDEETVSIYTMVMVGKVNKEIITSLHKVGINAVGLSGIDGALIRAMRKKKLIIVDERGRKRIIEGGYTGKITSVNGGLLKGLLKDGYLPVVAPIALGDEGELLNVDGDRAAAYVAGGIRAERLLFLTDVPGVLIDGKPLSTMGVNEAEKLLPRIGFGMEKKVLASIEAVKMGVKECLIASGLVEHPIASAIEHKRATVIHLG